MKSNNLWKGLFVLFVVLGLSSCKNQEEIEEIVYTVTLYNNNEVVEVFDNIVSETIIDLPVLEKDGSVFVGWGEFGIIHYNEYTVTSDIELNALFEVATDVFTVFEFPDSDYPIIRITGYTGNATTLVIPQIIAGKIVEDIGENSFEDSSLVEVVIPIDADIGMRAFLNSTELQKVSFYGEYLLPATDVFGGTEYNDILTSYPSECVIAEGSIEEGSWTFEEGCPIIEVTEYDEFVINFVTYYSYHVIIDKNLADFSSPNTFNMFTFEGATALETIEIKPSDEFIFPNAFKGCTNLTTIIVPEENQYFSVVDGVLYNQDQTSLRYYPVGLNATSFIIPDSVESIRTDAFFENYSLETIIIPENFTADFYVYGLKGLTEIIIDENNQNLYIIDGVLFKGNTLIKYPAALSGSSYTLPAGIDRIAPYAFAENQYLETIDLGDELLYIDYGAFYNAKNLVLLNIPASCLSINYNAISGSSIETVIINRSEIVDGTITYQGGSFTITDMENLRIYVPDDSIDQYFEDVMWYVYHDYIHPLSEYIQP